jgi:hypothetical protein
MHEPINGTCYYSEESNDDDDDFVIPNNDLDDYDEYVLDMIYDNALDDSPILLDHTLCLTIVINSRNEKMINLLFVNILLFRRALYYSSTPLTTP